MSAQKPRAIRLREKSEREDERRQDDEEQTQAVDADESIPRPIAGIQA